MRARVPNSPLPSFNKDGSEKVEKNKSPYQMSYLKLILYGLLALLMVKFLIYTEPMTLEEVQGEGGMVEHTMVSFQIEKFGEVVIELFPDHAPKTVAQFLQLVDSGFYSSNAGVYRNEPGYLLQAGGFMHDYVVDPVTIPVEYSLPSEERMVVLARNKDSNSGSTEFAIMLANNTLNNAPRNDNPGYTAFGRVFEGWSHIKHMEATLAKGFLHKQDSNQKVLFKDVVTVSRPVPTQPELRTAFLFVKDLLETDYSVVMFSKTTCPYCKAAKGILIMTLHASVKIIEIDQLVNGPAVQDALELLTGQRTVPNVFIGGKSIGGGDDTERLYQSGALSKQLDAAGALAKHTLLQSIQNNPLVIFSKTTCPYCRAAKETFESLGAKPVVFELDQRKDGAALKYYLNELTGRATVPNVFLKTESIGGGDEVEALQASGELKLLLQKAKVL